MSGGTLPGAELAFNGRLSLIDNPVDTNVFGPAKDWNRDEVNYASDMSWKE